MKYEPLKGKERVIQYIGYIRRMDGGIHRIPFIKKGFLTDDVKSAVQGLLEEIEKMEKFYENMREQHKEDKELNHVFTAKRDTVSRIKNKIKKWFADVVEGEE